MCSCGECRGMGVVFRVERVATLLPGSLRNNVGLLFVFNIDYVTTVLGEYYHSIAFGEVVDGKEIVSNLRCGNGR